MADIILPDSRWEQPELLYPNRKPVGNVKIDWENPLTRGLELCVVARRGVNFDLVAGKKVTAVAGAYDIHYPHGLCLNGTGASYYKISGNFSPQNVTYAFVHIMEAGERSNYTRIIDLYDGVNFEYGTTSGALSVAHKSAGVPGGWLYVNGARLNDPGETVIVHSAEGNTANQHFNSIKYGPYTRTRGISNDVEAVIFANATSYSSIGKGSIPLLVISSRAWSDAEAASFSRNPYQFLIPA